MAQKKKLQYVTFYNLLNEYAKQKGLMIVTEIVIKTTNSNRMVTPDASIVNNQRVVFNIKGNDYRLIVSINFSRKAVIPFGLGHTKNIIK